MAHADYLDVVCSYTSMALHIPLAIDALKKIEFDSIVVTGVSGLTFGSVLAYELEKHLVVVRKPSDEDNHSGFRVECHRNCKRWVFVDDFVSSGKTVKMVYNEIGNSSQLKTADFVGMLSYKSRTTFEPAKSIKERYIR